MPRYARLHAPGSLVHVVSRFVNYEFRLIGHAERALALDCLGRCLAGTDWRLHAYALMSSHLHLALTAGHDPPRRLLQPLLGSLARRLNRRQRRFGPLVGDRATTLVMSSDHAAELVAYLHNNPVRAAVVTDAGLSDWTSHRAWQGDAPAPPWLAVAEGLAMAGFGATDGRAAFGRFVRERAAAPRDPLWSARALPEARRESRRASGLPVELSSPCLRSPRGLEAAVLSPPGGGTPRWGGDLRQLLAACAGHGGVPEEWVLARSKRPRAVRARRLALVAGTALLQRPVREVAAALALSASSASRHLRGCDPLLGDARLVAARVLEDTAALDYR